MMEYAFDKFLTCMTVLYRRERPCDSSASKRDKEEVRLVWPEKTLSQRCAESKDRRVH